MFPIALGRGPLREFPSKFIFLNPVSVPIADETLPWRPAKRRSSSSSLPSALHSTPVALHSHGGPQPLDLSFLSLPQASQSFPSELASIAAMRVTPLLAWPLARSGDGLACPPFQGTRRKRFSRRSRASRVHWTPLRTSPAGPLSGTTTGEPDWKLGREALALDIPGPGGVSPSRSGRVIVPLPATMPGRVLRFQHPGAQLTGGRLPREPGGEAARSSPEPEQRRCL